MTECRADWRVRGVTVRKSGKNHFCTETNLKHMVTAALEPLKIVDTSEEGSNVKTVQDSIFSASVGEINILLGPIELKKCEAWSLRYALGYGDDNSEDKGNKNDYPLFQANNTGQVKMSPHGFLTIGGIFHCALKFENQEAEWARNWRKVRDSFFGPDPLGTVLKPEMSLNQKKMILLASRFESQDELRVLGHLYKCRAHLMSLLLAKQRLGKIAVENIQAFEAAYQNFDQKVLNFRLEKDVAGARTAVRNLEQVHNQMGEKIHDYLNGESVLNLPNTIGIKADSQTLLDMFRLRLHGVSHYNQITVNNVMLTHHNQAIAVYDLTVEDLSSVRGIQDLQFPGYTEKSEGMKQKRDELLNLIDSHQEDAAQEQLEAVRAEAQSNQQLLQAAREESARLRQQLQEQQDDTENETAREEAERIARQELEAAREEATRLREQLENMRAGPHGGHPGGAQGGQDVPPHDVLLEPDPPDRGNAVANHLVLLVQQMQADREDKKREREEEKRRKDQEKEEKERRQAGQPSKEEEKIFLARTLRAQFQELNEQIIRIKRGKDTEHSVVSYTYDEKVARVQAALTTLKDIQTSYAKFREKHLDDIQTEVNGELGELTVFLIKASITLEKIRSELRDAGDRAKETKKDEKTYISTVYIESFSNPDDFSEWWYKHKEIIKKAESVSEEVALLQFTTKLKRNLPYKDQNLLVNVNKLGVVLKHLQSTYLTNPLLFQKRLQILNSLKSPSSDGEVLKNSNFCIELINEIKFCGYLSLIEKKHIIMMERGSMSAPDLDLYRDILVKFDKLTKENQLRYLKGEATLESFDRAIGLSVIKLEEGEVQAETVSVTTTEMQNSVNNVLNQTEVTYRLELYIQNVKKNIEKRKMKASDNIASANSGRTRQSRQETGSSNYNKSKYNRHQENLFKSNDAEEDCENSEEDSTFYGASGSRSSRGRGRGGRDRGRGGRARGRGRGGSRGGPRGRGRGGLEIRDRDRSRGRERRVRFQSDEDSGGRRDRPEDRPQPSWSGEPRRSTSWSREERYKDNNGNSSVRRESRQRRTYRRERSAGGYRGNSQDRERRQPPQKPCPLNCNKKHSYGSAAFCPNFLKMSILARRELIGSMKLIQKCCLRQNAHSSDQKCRAPACAYCGGNHHKLLCLHGDDGTKNKADLPKNVRHIKEDDPPEEDYGDREYNENDDWGEYDEDDWYESEDEYQDDYQDDYYYDDEEDEEESYAEERTFKVRVSEEPDDTIFALREIPVLSEIEKPDLHEINTAIQSTQPQMKIFFGPDPDRDYRNEIEEDQHFITDTKHPLILEMAELVRANISGERTGLTEVIKLRDKLKRENKMEEFKERVKPLMKNYVTLSDRLGLKDPPDPDSDTEDVEATEDIIQPSLPPLDASTEAKNVDEAMQTVEIGEKEKPAKKAGKVDSKKRNKKDAPVSLNLPALINEDETEDEVDEIPGLTDSDTTDQSEEDTDSEYESMDEAGYNPADDDWLREWLRSRRSQRREEAVRIASDEAKSARDKEAAEKAKEKKSDILSDIQLENNIRTRENIILYERDSARETKSQTTLSLKRSTPVVLQRVEDLKGLEIRSDDTFLSNQSRRDRSELTRARSLVTQALFTPSPDSEQAVIRSAKKKGKRLQRRNRAAWNSRDQIPLRDSRLYRQRNITREEAQRWESVSHQVEPTDPNQFIEITEDSENKTIRNQFQMMLSEAQYLSNKRNRNLQPIYRIRIVVPDNLPAPIKKKWNIKRDRSTQKDYLTTLALDDSGSDIEILSTEIFEDIFRGHEAHISPEEGARINGVVAAETKKQEQRVRFDIITPPHNPKYPAGFVRMSCGLSDNLGSHHQMDELGAAFVARSFGINEDEHTYYGLDRLAPMKIGILTSERGADKMSKILSDHQIRNLGLKTPLTSPNLKLRKTEISYDQEYCVSGSLGINPVEVFKNSHSFKIHPAQPWTPMGIVEFEGSDNKCMIKFEDLPPCQINRADLIFDEDMILTEKLVREPEEVARRVEATLEGTSEEETDEKISTLLTEEQKLMDSLLVDPLYRDKLELQKIGLSALGCYRAPVERESEKMMDLDERIHREGGMKHDPDNDNKFLSRGIKDLVVKFGLFSVEKADTVNIRFTANEKILHEELQEKIRRAREDPDYKVRLWDALYQHELSFIYQNPLCTEHQQQTKTCQKCRYNAKLNSEVDREIFEKIVDGSRLVEDGKMPDGTPKYRLVFKLVVDGDRNVIFNPELSNEKETVNSLRRNFRKWGKQKTAAGERKSDAIHKELMKDVELGTLIPVSEEEMREIRKLPHSFIPTNATEKPTSETTKTRLIFDTSRSLPTATTHSLAIRSPKDKLNSIYNTVAAFMAYEDGANSDISRAYKQLWLEYEDSILCLTAWLKDPNSPDGELQYYRNATHNFGISQAAVALVVGVAYHVWGQAKLPETKVALRKSGFADDLCFSQPSSKKMDEIIDDVRYSHLKCGFTTKYPFRPVCMDPEVLEHHEPIVDSFGMNIDLLTNTIQPSAEININEKKKGRAKGPDISKASWAEIEDLKVTKRLLLRATMQQFSLLGTMSSISQINGKLLVARTNGLTKLGEYDEDLGAICPDVCVDFRNYLWELRNWNSITHSRFLIPKNYKFSHIVNFRDGSAVAYSSVTFMISKKVQPEIPGPPVFSYIASAKSLLSDKTVPVNETYATLLASHEIKDVVERYHYIVEKKKDVKIVSFGDSKSITYCWSKKIKIKNISARNSIVATNTNFDSIVRNNENIQITLNWIAGDKNISDLNSKKSNANSIEITNSYLWQFGNEYTAEPERLEEGIFFLLDHKKREYRPMQLEGLEITKEIEILMQPYQRKAKIKDETVEIKKVYYEDARPVAGDESFETVGAGHYAIPASDGFIEEMISELKKKNKVQDFLTYFNQNLTGQSRGGAKVYWTDLVTLAPTIKGDENRMIRTILEKARYRLNQEKRSVNFTSHLIRLTTMLSPSVGEHMRRFRAMEFSPEHNNKVSRTEPYGKNLDGSLRVGETEDLKLDTIPHQVEQMIHHQFDFAEESSYEDYFINNLHLNFDKDESLPPEKIKRLKISDKEKTHLAVMASAGFLSKYNKGCQQLGIPRRRKEDIPPRRPRTTSTGEQTRTRTVAVDALRLFQNKLWKENVNRRMMPYITSLFCDRDEFTGCNFSMHEVVVQMLNAENMLRSNMVRPSRNKTKKSSDPPPVALKHPDEKTTDWCDDCQQEHKHVKPNKNKKDESPPGPNPVKRPKLEYPELDMSENRSMAERFIKAENNNQRVEDYWKTKLFYKLFDEEEKDEDAERNETILETIEDLVDRAFEMSEGYSTPMKTKQDPNLRTSPREYWIEEARDPGTLFDWVAAEEPDNVPNLDRDLGFNFYEVNHLNAHSPGKLSFTYRDQRTFSYYNKYDNTNTLERERPVYPYSGVRKPDMLNRKLKKIKQKQIKKILFSIPLKRYQDALKMRKATRETGVARAQMAVSHVLRQGVGYIPGIEGDNSHILDSDEEDEEDASRSGGITSDSEPDVVIDMPTSAPPPPPGGDPEPEEGDLQEMDLPDPPGPAAQRVGAGVWLPSLAMQLEEEASDEEMLEEDSIPGNARALRLAMAFVEASQNQREQALNVAAAQGIPVRPGPRAPEPPEPPAIQVQLHRGPPPTGIGLEYRPLAPVRGRPTVGRVIPGTDGTPYSRLEFILADRNIDRAKVLRAYGKISDSPACRSDVDYVNPGHLRCPCNNCDFVMTDLPVPVMDEAATLDNKSILREAEDFCEDANLLTVLPVLTRSALREVERETEKHGEDDLTDEQEEMWSTKAERSRQECETIPGIIEEIDERAEVEGDTRLDDSETEIEKRKKLLEQLRSPADNEGTQSWRRSPEGRLWRILEAGSETPTSYQSELEQLYRPLVMNIIDFKDTLSDTEKLDLKKNQKAGLWCDKQYSWTESDYVDWYRHVAQTRLLHEFWRAAEALLHDQRSRNLVQRQLCPDNGFGLICPETYAVLEDKTNCYEKFLKIIFLVTLAATKFKKLLDPNYVNHARDRRKANERKFGEIWDDYPVNLIVSPTLGRFVATPEEVLRRAVYVMLRSDQAKYLPALTDKEGDLDPKHRYFNGGNIICQQYRLACEDQIRLHRTTSLPVLHPDSPLLRKLIFHHHEMRIGPVTFLNKRPHWSAKQTAARTKSSTVGVTSTELGKIVQGLVHTCAPCLRAFAKKYAVAAGKCYSNLGTASRAFSVVSADPLPGAIRARFSSGRNNFCTFHVLCFTCISTGASVLIPMTEMTRESVEFALQDLEIMTKCRVNYLVSDAGTQFVGAALMNGHTRVLTHPRGSQFRNRVERSIQSLKKVWRSLFSRQKNEPFSRALTIPEVFLLLHLTQAAINTFPYIDSGLSPDHLMRPLGYVQPEEEFEKRAREFGQHFYNGNSPDGTAIYTERMKNFMKDFNQERIAEIILEEKRFRAKEYPGIVAPEVGDIIYYKDPAQYNTAKLGRIIKINEDETSALIEWSGVRSDGKSHRRNLQKMALRTLHPLVSLRQQYHLGNPDLPKPDPTKYPDLVSTKDILSGATNTLGHAGCMRCQPGQLGEAGMDDGRDSSDEEEAFEAEMSERGLWVNLDTHKYTLP